MNKSNHFISVVNIVVFLLFTIGFFVGGTFISGKNDILYRLSANPILLHKAEKEEGRHIKLVAKIIPAIDGVNKPAVSNITPPKTNYTPNAPVLASENGENIQIKNDTVYDIDTDEFLKRDINTAGSVLIIHTHTSEAYMMDDNNTYSESDPYRTQDENKNMIHIGNIVEKALRAGGIDVIHDKTIHDYPSYTGSYKRALTTAQNNINNNKNIFMVLDIHRDAIINENGEYMKTLAEIKGINSAKAMIVIGTDGSGLEHKNWRENLSFGIKLMKTANEKYPSLMRPLHLCNERYNGHMSKGAMIIEIGSNMNTLPEAEKCAQLVGECISELITAYRERQ